MAGLKFDIDVDGWNKIKKALARRCTKAEHIVAIQVEKDTSPYTPALTGSLNQRTRVVGNSVVYPGPYARYLYYGKLMVDPDTGSPWAQPGAVKVLTDRDLVFNKSFHGDAQAHWFEASKAQNLDKWRRVAAENVYKK
uniref:Minor capsid protein n=1 Tax=Siphoviridae sp. cthae16 TaxID=2825617 RepID=A0A8S5URI5_9CAUD|nr:MAG TPA: Minor capsid protein [Siphoviridae sp. cthae16]